MANRTETLQEVADRMDKLARECNPDSPDYVPPKHRMKFCFSYFGTRPGVMVLCERTGVKTYIDTFGDGTLTQTVSNNDDVGEFLSIIQNAAREKGNPLTQTELAELRKGCVINEQRKIAVECAGCGQELKVPDYTSAKEHLSVKPTEPKVEQMGTQMSVYGREFRAYQSRLQSFVAQPTAFDIAKIAGGWLFGRRK